MKKEFDCVQLMREIREKLSEKFRNPEIENKELRNIRRKYGISN